MSQRKWKLVWPISVPRIQEQEDSQLHADEKTVCVAQSIKNLTHVLIRIALDYGNVSCFRYIDALSTNESYQKMTTYNAGLELPPLPISNIPIKVQDLDVYLQHRTVPNTESVKYGNKCATTIEQTSGNIQLFRPMCFLQLVRH